MYSGLFQQPFEKNQYQKHKYLNFNIVGIESQVVNQTKLITQLKKWQIQTSKNAKRSISISHIQQIPYNIQYKRKYSTYNNTLLISIIIIYNHMDPPQQHHKFPHHHHQPSIPEQIFTQWSEQQKKIRDKIIQYDDHQWTIDTIQLICGVDLSANKDKPEIACAGLVVYNIKKYKIMYEDYQVVTISQPYIPGFLAFRQIPPFLQLFKKLKNTNPQCWPQLILLDGNGILHPNQCGLACHLGVILNLPTLGVGKKLFQFDGLQKYQIKKLCENSLKKQNDYILLTGKSGKIWGAGLRNGKNTTNPVYVSIGNKISLEIAIKCVILSSIHRVPEPIRLADKKSREIIQGIDITSDCSGYKKYGMDAVEQFK